MKYELLESLAEAKVELNPDEVIGAINMQMQPGIGDQEPWEPILETIGAGSDVNPKKAAKDFIRILEKDYLRWKRDLKGMDRYVNLNPWKKWNDDAIANSPYFDHLHGDLPAQKKDFKEFQKQVNSFISEVKKLLGVR